MAKMSRKKLIWTQKSMVIIQLIYTIIKNYSLQKIMVKNQFTEPRRYLSYNLILENRSGWILTTTVLN